LSWFRARRCSDPLRANECQHESRPLRSQHHVGRHAPHAETDARGRDLDPFDRVRRDLVRDHRESKGVCLGDQVIVGCFRLTSRPPTRHWPYQWPPSRKASPCRRRSFPTRPRGFEPLTFGSIGRRSAAVRRSGGTKHRRQSGGTWWICEASMVDPRTVHGRSARLAWRICRTLGVACSA